MKYLFIIAALFATSALAEEPTKGSVTIKPSGINLVAVVKPNDIYFVVTEQEAAFLGRALDTSDLPHRAVVELQTKLQQQYDAQKKPATVNEDKP